MARTINVKLILELRHSGMSMNDIAEGNHISKHSVSEVCRIAQRLGITEDEVIRSDNEQLYRRFFPDKRTAQEFYEPVDYDYVHRELRKPGVTLQLLHDEYKDECRQSGKVSVGYSKFCNDYSNPAASRTTSITSLGTG